ncbi:hypothetical protein AB0D94_34600 [Streptomyces sp. NPDC048255]|uniref:hypothetical protein n=1 Tax=Streptomyces sp. NPDC048255 TaxID=3154713 RepID=UPI0033D99C2F
MFEQLGCRAAEPDHLLRQRLVVQQVGGEMAIIDGDRIAAQAAMERIAKEARESGNVEVSAEAWRALAESLAAANGVRDG